MSSVVVETSSKSVLMSSVYAIFFLVVVVEEGVDFSYNILEKHFILTYKYI
jgi:predicted regulator of Ras-like GTPase activity (Roadblock/LC7/MglB family)